VGWKEVAACPCGHTFHYHCILRWSEDCKRARKKPECPTCKMAVEVDKQPKCLVPKLFFAFDGDDAENEWNSGNISAVSSSDSEAFVKMKEDLNNKNALTYTLQNKVRVLEKDVKEWESRLHGEVSKREKTERDLKEEKTKRATIVRQMEGFKMQAGDVQKVHDQNEVLKKKLDECKTIEKVLKESTNQVESELLNHGRSAEELAKYLIILKREMERHIGEKRKYKEEAKKASEENFKFENELERLRREAELKQEKIDELRKDNSALIKRIRSSNSPATSVAKRKYPDGRHPLSADDNFTPKQKGGTMTIETPEPGFKRPRTSLDPPNLDSSLDLFSSPLLGTSADRFGSPVLATGSSRPSVKNYHSVKDGHPGIKSSHPGQIVTPESIKLTGNTKENVPLMDPSIDPSTPASNNLRAPLVLSDASPSLAIAKDVGIDYVKTTSGFDALSKKAVQAVVTPESVAPVRRPGGGGGLLGRVGTAQTGCGAVRTGFNATGGTSKFLHSGASCGGGLPRVASFAKSSSALGISKFHKTVLDQQKKNKFSKQQPSLNNFFGS